MSFSIILLEKSLENIRDRQDEFASSFYKRLFANYPEFQPLFAKTDMNRQKQMLVASLILVVKNLQKPQLLTTTLKGLGARHIQYCPTEEYDAFLNNLLATFQEVLGSDWTTEMQQAWVEAYEDIVKLMKLGFQESKNL